MVFVGMGVAVGEAAGVLCGVSVETGVALAGGVTPGGDATAVGVAWSRVAAVGFGVGVAGGAVGTDPGVGVVTVGWTTAVAISAGTVPDATGRSGGVGASGAPSGANGTTETNATPPRESQAPLRLVPTIRLPSLQRI